MKTKYIALAVTLALLIGAGAALAAGTTAGWHRHRMAWIARQLDLTEAQKAQIKQMIQSDRPTLNPLLQQLASNRQQMLAATADGAFDQAKVQALANQQAQIIAQLIVERQKLISQVYQNVLTADQRVKANALRQKMSERMGQRLEHLQSELTEQ